MREDLIVNVYREGNRYNGKISWAKDSTKKKAAGFVILEKLKSLDKNPTNNSQVPEDQRDFGTGAQILKELGVSKIRLISNHNRKRVGLIGYGLEIVENIVLE